VPVLKEIRAAEMDELFTFIGSKKRIYILTTVDRQSHYYLGMK